ncbi:hypothetical protein PC118_g23493 [Phytophthora cactorum]|uniref:Uncharacterized protein n=2 Tax=Phytophthora cactorum TaxID=29920 RepID=A0A8T1EQ78_9STRA|nr:hypothetical protein PC118_g23493 [Phytophthora cactorum]
MRHSEFLAMLQAQLLDFTADDFKRGTSSPGPGTPHEARTADQHCHELVECPEFQTIGGVQRRARSSVLDSKKRAYLCIVCARTVRTGTRATRFDTWSWTTAGTARARASDMPSRCGRRPPSRDTSAVAPQRGKTTKAPSLRLPATKTVLTGAKTGMSPTVW